MKTDDRVTILALENDRRNVSIQQNMDTDNIEIVPRRLVEKIIEKCAEQINRYPNPEEGYEWGYVSASQTIYNHTKEWLEDFEKGGSDEQ